MSADFSTWGRRALPVLRISFRTESRSSQIVVSPAGLALGLFIALTAAAASCYLVVRCAVDERTAAAGRVAELRMERANADLQDTIAALQDKLGVVARDRAQMQSELASLSSQSGELRGLLYTAEEKLQSLAEKRSQLSQQTGAIQEQLSASERTSSSKASRIAQLTQTLAQVRRELHDAQAQRATLMARLSKVEADAQAVQGERQRASGERDRLRARINALEQKLSLRARRGAGREVASAAAAPARGVAAPAQRAVAYGPARRGLREVERVLASTGLDVEKLLAKFDTSRAEGGPFVPPPKGGRLPDQLGMRKLLALHRLAKALPISAPLGSYRLTSPFGIRHDPFNGREEFHTGVDLSAPFMTPVYATAPGTVTYAGWRTGYGKVVEIDHGNGISTRYAHLHRYTVLVGQKVRAHTQVGYVGTTGRSTGPHVHYEVLVNGEPQNPEKFFSLARLIPVAAR
jgi:murein DD-endopeptidase MepM/ murein hydrolase activator NlpD